MRKVDGSWYNYTSFSQSTLGMTETKPNIWVTFDPFMYAVYISQHFTGTSRNLPPPCLSLSLKKNEKTHDNYSQVLQIAKKVCWSGTVGKSPIPKTTFVFWGRAHVSLTQPFPPQKSVNFHECRMQKLEALSKNRGAVNDSSFTTFHRFWQLRWQSHEDCSQRKLENWTAKWKLQTIRSPFN